MDGTIPPGAIDEPPPDIKVPRPGTNLYRSPARVGILSLVGFLTYPIWWRWQLFKFTGREAFPRARSFWWTLIPIFGWVVIWEQLDDLKKAAANKNIRVRAGLIFVLLLGGSLAGFVRLLGASPSLVAAVLLLSAVLTAVAIYLGQRSIVDYLAATNPTARPRRISVGEIVAVLLTVSLLAVGGFAYYRNAPASEPAVTYLPAANPVADTTLPGGWTQYRDQGSGFAIQLPADWASVAYDAAARGVKPIVGLKFYAEANDKSANLALMRRVSRPTALDAYVVAVDRALAVTGAQDVTHTRVTLPVGEAEQFRFRRTFADPGGTVTEEFVEYVVVGTSALRTTVYFVQFDLGSANTYSTDAAAWSIMTTFRRL